MPKKKLTDKMLREIVNNQPKPLIDYWIENTTKPIDSLLSYSKGFYAGMDFVVETIVKPYLDRVDKILNPPK